MAAWQRSKPMSPWKYAAMGLQYRGPLRLKRFLLIQLIAGVLFLYLWITLNGGLVPWFWKKTSVKPVSNTGVHLLTYFPHADQDGSRITWLHRINRFSQLEEALKSNTMMLEGDVMLKGQGTGEQQLVPIMAHPPDVSSDVTLEAWLDQVKGTGKGLKLDFKSIEVVEIALQKLRELKPQLRAPVWLSADVLVGPNGDPKAIDVHRFIRLCTTIFPESTLSLGWTTADSPDNTKTVHMYTWPMVKSMHDLVEKYQVKQPLTFAVRASYFKNSVSQIKWLTEMTGSTITVFSLDRDNIELGDLLYIRHKFSHRSVFYDLPASTLQLEFNRAKEEGLGSIPGHLLQKDEKVFKAEQWKIVKSKVGETIYMGRESVVINKGLLISKQEYKGTPSSPLHIQGQVTFLDIPVDNDQLAVTGLEIFLRVSQASNLESLSGIKCFLGLDGTLRISTQSIPGADAREETKIQGKPECLNFEITDSGEQVTLFVSMPTDCATQAPTEVVQGSVALPLYDIKTEGSNFLAIKISATNTFAAIPEFYIGPAQKF